MRCFGTVLLLAGACAALPAVARTVAAQVSATRCYAATEFDLHPGPVQVDLDGDGVLDTVSTSASWIDSSSCTASLTVQTATQTYTAPVGSPDFPLIAPPPIAAVARFTRQQTLILAVRIWSGASTSFTQLFQLSRGRLFELDQKPFPFDGSVTDRRAIDCARNRRAGLVSSEALYRHSQYLVWRRFYALRGQRLRLLPRLTQRYRVAPSNLERRFPAFRQSLFRRCAVARPT